MNKATDNVLDSIYATHKQGLFSLALSISGCRSAAEDAIHHAFSKMLVAELGTSDDPVAYVFRSVRNASIDQQRKRSRTKRVHESIFNGYAPPPKSQFENPDARVLTEERDQILRDAISELPESPQHVVLLRTFSGLTFEQVGSILGIPAKTAATQYRRALMKLKERLEDQL